MGDMKVLNRFSQLAYVTPSNTKRVLLLMACAPWGTIHASPVDVGGLGSCGPPDILSNFAMCSMLEIGHVYVGIGHNLNLDRVAVDCPLS